MLSKVHVGWLLAPLLFVVAATGACRCLPFNNCKPWDDRGVQASIASQLKELYGEEFKAVEVLRPYGSRGEACVSAIPLNTVFNATGPDARSYSGSVNMHFPHGVSSFNYRAHGLLRETAAAVERELAAAAPAAGLIVVAISKPDDWDLPTSSSTEEINEYVFVFGVTVDLPYGTPDAERAAITAALEPIVRRSGVDSASLTVRTRRER